MENQSNNQTNIVIGAGNLNQLQTIIDKPGKYVTRNGSIVEIDTILEDKFIFNAMGFYFEPHGKTWETWHKSGRLLPHDENGMDIVKKSDS